MIIDIREDVPDLLQYVQLQVNKQVESLQKRPTPTLVSRIDFGFEFGQANWVALVFDTRENAEPDGEWTNSIDRILLKRPRWPIWHKLPDDAAVSFINMAGQTVDVMPDPDHLICTIIGDALKHVLLTARDQGVFNLLPKRPRCELAVENLEGYYGWPVYKERGKENLA